MRSVGGEILSTLTALAIPLGIVAVFPVDSLRFRATETAGRPVRTAFVTMTPEAEQQALRLVRVSWREKVGRVRRPQADLFCSTLPEDGRISVLSIQDRSRPPVPPKVLCDRMPFLPSQKASPPRSIAAGAADEPLAFPREELLKMN